MGSISGPFKVEDALLFADGTRMGGARPREGCGVLGKTVSPMTALETQRAREKPAACRHLL
jgi:hypothetical protein